MANHLIWPTMILGAAGTAQLIRIMRAHPWFIFVSTSVRLEI